MSRSLEEMYEEGLSLPDICRLTGVAISTVRNRLMQKGVKLRSREEALNLPNMKEKLGTGLRGKSRIFTKKHKQAISRGRFEYFQRVGAKGVRITSQGYLEFTTGLHKARRVHRVLMEMLIGRKLAADEVVHHRDFNRLNNDVKNLKVMKNKKHAQLHARINSMLRTRDRKGRFDSRPIAKKERIQK